MARDDKFDTTTQAPRWAELERLKSSRSRQA
jgi:hypothetical protein